jgi:hypothetical protein
VKAAPISMLLLPSDDKQKECSKTLGPCNPDPIVADIGHPLSEGRSKSEYDFQPRPEDAFPTFEESSRMFLAAGLAGGAFFGLALLYLHKVPEGASVEVKLGVAGLGVGALTCTFWEPFAQFVTSHGMGEPIVVLEGVSVWPTVLLRILGIILAVYFIWRSEISLRSNLAEIADEMKLEFPKPLEKRTLWSKIKYVFDFSLRGEQADSALPLNVRHAWDAYASQERFWSRRFWRASLYTLLMFGFFRLILVPMLGKPEIPARGDLAYYAYYLTIYIDGILMLFLTLYVFDATLFCLLFVNKLRRPKAEWPKATIMAFDDRMRLQPDLIVHDWIDLEFVAKRTACIGWLIYYPFLLIALLIVSRSSVFANYAPSPTILVVQGISLSVVFGCAIMLWWAATAARDAARQNLTDKIIWAKRPSTVIYSINDATTHTDSPANKCDAEPPAVQPDQADLRPPSKDSEDTPRYAEQLESLLSRVNQLNDGAFGPLSKQPLVRALLFPLSSAGWVALIENGMLPGL